MKHVEDDHQRHLFTWARMATIHGIRVGDYLIAIPNGGKRNVREAARLKAQGVKAGVSDIFLALPRGHFSGLWIELKAPKGKAQANQLEWLDRMGAAGYSAVMCWGWEDAKKTIEEYIKQKKGA